MHWAVCVFSLRFLCCLTSTMSFSFSSDWCLQLSRGQRIRPVSSTWICFHKTAFITAMKETTKFKTMPNPNKSSVIVQLNSKENDAVSLRRQTDADTEREREIYILNKKERERESNMNITWTLCGTWWKKNTMASAVTIASSTKKHDTGVRCVTLNRCKKKQPSWRFIFTSHRINDFLCHADWSMTPEVIGCHL